jgi:predicted MPP superfamily phosphohydrolase
MIDRPSVKSDLCYALQTDYVALLGQRGNGVRTIVSAIVREASSVPNMKFISIALPRKMQGEEFKEFLLNRLREAVIRIPSEANLATAVEQAIKKYETYSPDFRLRTVLDTIGKKTSAKYFVIVLHSLAEVLEEPLKNLLLLLREYHNQRDTPGDAGEKLRFLVAGDVRLWRLCYFPTVEKSPFNIARRIFLGGFSHSELQECRGELSDEYILACCAFTGGVPSLVEDAITRQINSNHPAHYFAHLQNNWNSLPLLAREILGKVVLGTETLPGCIPDYGCPEIPEIESPWLESFWEGFLKIDRRKLIWRSSIHEAFVAEHTQYKDGNSTGPPTQGQKHESPSTMTPISIPSENSPANAIWILHLSDLHMKPDTDPFSRLQPVIADLQELEGTIGLKRLDYLIVSGDLTNSATPEEFKRSRQLISGIIDHYNLPLAHCIVVPGNHDLSWDEEVYQWKSGRIVNPGKLKDGTYCAKEDGFLIRDERKYPSRFRNFKNFYKALIKQQYPSAFKDQCIPHFFPEDRIQFLAMNSAWEIDEHFRKRSSINEAALVRGLKKADDQIKHSIAQGQTPGNAKILRLAISHHPVAGKEMIESDAFLEQLQKAHFKLSLHGHVHENRADIINYVHPTRKLYVAGAGSFGAPAKDRPESRPRLYNVLEISSDYCKVRVHTRCKKKDSGAWEGYAEWPDESNHNARLTYYDIQI